jgi:hypothetical protein
VVLWPHDVWNQVSMGSLSPWFSGSLETISMSSFVMPCRSPKILDFSLECMKDLMIGMEEIPLISGSSVCSPSIVSHDSLVFSVNWQG